MQRKEGWQAVCISLPPFFEICHRIASFFRLALTQKSGTEIHCYFRNAVLAERREGTEINLEFSACTAAGQKTPN